MVVLEIFGNKEKIWMMKNLKILILINILLIFSSCGTLKEGFKNQKKNNSDEFLVQKKSPLVMPPEYGQLPTPKQEANKTESMNSTSVKNLLLSEENNSTNLKEESDINKNFEEKLLEKIKKN